MSQPTTYHVGRFPPANLDWSRLIPLLGPASAAVARYDASLIAIPNAAVLLAPLTMQEAVLSSRIEGTQATIEEVLQFEAADSDASLSPEKRADIEEVLNYRRAMGQAVDLMRELPICNRLIKALHETLLSGVRGHDKARGAFRTYQNYIGVYGRPIEEARFIPIAPEQLEAGMSRWEQYVHSATPDVLVQLAIVHAEFEMLHPFLDGNGRIGRMLIPLFLYERNVLREPMFYLSEYLEAHRSEYYDRLLAVSRDDDWTGWCEFFLRATRQQAAHNEARVRRIFDLYQHRKEWIIEQTRSPYAIWALDFIFSNPIFNASQFVKASRAPRATAHRILDVLVSADLFATVQDGKGRRPTVFAYTELLDITEGVRDVDDHP
ncbi:MAG TPA: Fic/DOC family N-terminal domain-containing protein [Nitrolancea sp.]|nr:Fic/DOC family N-terminal domain-containing protein [Nitrolancea sp.]